MLSVNIPNFGDLNLQHLVCDFSGTLSVDGCLVPGVIERLENLSKSLAIHVITSDTHGKVRDEIKAEFINMHILEGYDHTGQKKDFVRKLDPPTVVAIGNGNNDCGMLKTARIGICVCLDESCSTKAISSADIFVKSITDALDLLLYPNRLIATLRK
jgi:soluble P-type ATPase